MLIWILKSSVFLLDRSHLSPCCTNAQHSKAKQSYRRRFGYGDIDRGNPIEARNARAAEI